jgi:hypothetical protein
MDNTDTLPPPPEFAEALDAERLTMYPSAEFESVLEYEMALASLGWSDSANYVPSIFTGVCK